MGTVTINKQKIFEIIEDVLREIAKNPPRIEDVQFRVILDRVDGFFEIKAIGWNSFGRVHGSIIHIDVIDDKVLIRHNGTELEIKDILIEKGIPRELIILDFIHPKYQKYVE